MDHCDEAERAGDSAGGMEAFGRLKARLLRCIDSLEASEFASCYSCKELKKKVETNSFDLVVVGQFKRGKTYLINALLGEEILPVAVVPLTSVITVLTFGETLSIKVFLKNGGVSEIGRGELADYVTEAGNPENVKNVSRVVITYPSPYLRDGVRLIDTPGVGSVFQHNTDVAYRCLPKSDAALFLLSVEQPASKAELDFLRDVRRYSGRIFFLLNKIDYLSEDEIRDSLAFSRRVIGEAMGTEVNVYPISAKLALRGKIEKSQEMLRDSFLPRFSERLTRFLMHEKGVILLSSVAGGLLRVIVQARLELELELKSFAEPIEQLKEKIKAFGKKKVEVAAWRNDFGVLLGAEVERLVKSKLDGNLSLFGEKLGKEMEEGLTRLYEENRDASLKDLKDALEAYVAEKTGEAFEEWRLGEDEELGAAFEALCKKYLGDINGKIESLLRFSSELFTVAFENVRTEPLWTMKPTFLYQLQSEPVGLEMLEASVTQAIPKVISRRFARLKAFMFRLARKRIFKKIRQGMFETIDRQCGRVRFDFLQRLEKSSAAFRNDMMQKVDGAIEGLGEAIEKGVRQRSLGEGEAAARQSVLSRGLAELDGIKRELASIGEHLSSFSS